MRGHTNKLTLAAVLAALSLVILYLSVAVPTGRMGIIALAGLMPVAAVISGGVAAGTLCYAVTAVLAVILLPNKGNALLYVVFFGLYPLIKYAVERFQKLFLELGLKLIFFNLIFWILWFGLRAVLFLVLPLDGKMPWVLYLVCNGAFLVYDFGLTKLIAFYMIRIDRILHKR